MFWLLLAAGVCVTRWVPSDRTGRPGSLNLLPPMLLPRPRWGFVRLNRGPVHGRANRAVSLPYPTAKVRTRANRVRFTGIPRTAKPSAIQAPPARCVMRD